PLTTLSFSLISSRHRAGSVPFQIVSNHDRTAIILPDFLNIALLGFQRGWRGNKMRHHHRFHLCTLRQIADFTGRKW
ncbi:hypothetical protein, partial [Klebsiella pneumoniae]|uniref:hypothetical protein n=1 Tax=Klebsiella pneumoniae TaxID=573 RepID=UPI003854F6C5